jgi:hypothetical protein
MTDDGERTTDDFCLLFSVLRLASSAGNALYIVLLN